MLLQLASHKVHGNANDILVMRRRMREVELCNFVQEALVDQWCTVHKLRVNSVKTATFPCTKRRKLYLRDIILGNSIVYYENETKYL